MSPSDRRKAWTFGLFTSPFAEPMLLGPDRTDRRTEATMKTLDILRQDDPDAPTEFFVEGPYESSVEDCWGYCFCCGELRHSSCCAADTPDDDCEC